MKTSFSIFCAAVVALGLAGCSSAKETLGLNRSSPDEFMVVKHAPLSMPPDYTLRPPSPGAPRPQEQTTSETARTAVFGAQQAQAGTAPTSVESALLQQAGTTGANPDIRRVVDQESNALADRNKSVTDKLLNIGGGGEPSATVVNAREETQRLQQNAAQGKPVTDGETPVIEQ